MKLILIVSLGFICSAFLIRILDRGDVIYTEIARIFFKKNNEKKYE